MCIRGRRSVRLGVVQVDFTWKKISGRGGVPLGEWTGVVKRSTGNVDGTVSTTIGIHSNSYITNSNISG